MIVSHHTSNDGKQSARRAIKSFLGVQMLHGRLFKKAPWPPEASTRATETEKGAKPEENKNRSTQVEQKSITAIPFLFPGNARTTFAYTLICIPCEPAIGTKGHGELYT